MERQRHLIGPGTLNCEDGLRLLVQRTAGGQPDQVAAISRKSQTTQTQRDP